MADATLVEASGPIWTFTAWVLRPSVSTRQASSPPRPTSTLRHDPVVRFGQAGDGDRPAGRSLQFSYNGSGLVSLVTGPGGRTVSYGYNGSGELTSVTDVGGG